jgi:hypothetical protein
MALPISRTRRITVIGHNLVPIRRAKRGNEREFLKAEKSDFR